jgi:hypothetical protein
MPVAQTITQVTVLRLRIPFIHARLSQCKFAQLYKTPRAHPTIGCKTRNERRRPSTISAILFVIDSLSTRQPCYSTALLERSWVSGFQRRYPPLPPPCCSLPMQGVMQSRSCCQVGRMLHLRSIATLRLGRCLNSEARTSLSGSQRER